MMMMKNSNAAGADGINIEMLKTDIKTKVRILTGLFTNIWTEILYPGYMIKLLKKSDLGNCNNWRGITLLSVPSKFFCWIC